MSQNVPTPNVGQGAAQGPAAPVSYVTGTGPSINPWTDNLNATLPVANPSGASDGDNYFYNSAGELVSKDTGTTFQNFGSKSAELGTAANKLAAQYADIYQNQNYDYQQAANHVALPTTGQNLAGLGVAAQGMWAQNAAARAYQQQANGYAQQSVAQAQNNQALNAALASQQQAAGNTRGGNSTASATRQAMLAGGQQALAANNSGATARLQEQSNIDAQRLAGMQGVSATGAQLAAASLQQSKQGEQAAEYNRNQQVAQQQYYQAAAQNALLGQYNANQYGINTDQSLLNANHQAILGESGLSFQVAQNNAANTLNDVKLGVGAGTGLASAISLGNSASDSGNAALDASNAGVSAAIPDWAVAE